MWHGRLPREILQASRESYVTRTGSHVHKPVEGGVIDCALGTNPLGMAEAVRAQLAQAQEWDPSVYPAGDARALKERLRGYLGAERTEADEIIVGQGSIDILLTLLRLLLPPGSLLGGVSPQFTDVPLQATLHNIRYHPVVLLPPAYGAERETWIRSVRMRPHVLYIDRPHNPTGQVLPLETLQEICDLCEGQGTWVIVDGAYADYLPPEEWAVGIANPNLIVVRSFSKAMGLAGVRVGYAVIRDRELRNIYRKTHPPFTVSTPGEVLAAAALEDSAFLERTRRYAWRAKERLLDSLQRQALVTGAATDRRTPIMLLQRPRGNLAELFGGAGIAVEPGDGYMHLGENSARIRIPRPDQLEELTQRLERLEAQNTP
ncbi:MAG: aminotransferase class I/II-fold pyridoxal phosphate-dependent enzyme [Synergistales bacterium]|nr:aminotransferase class I/II-fold pyridoxal phosphate-dependent enzyme [Synergistales bacterium]